MLGGRESKKHQLQHIHQMQRKGQDLVPASQAVRSAMRYLRKIEKFFQEKSNNQVSVYPLLSFALNGHQDESQPNMISGRLFYNLACFIQKDLSKEIMEKSNKEFNTKDRKYNFISEEVIEKLGDMLKTRDGRKIEGILQSLVYNIDKNPAWIRFWQRRIGKEGVNQELINKITQALVYKIAGTCHEAYVQRNNPSIEQQRKDTNLISAFKTSALQVTSSLSLDELSVAKAKKERKKVKKEEKALSHTIKDLEISTERESHISTHSTDALPVVSSPLAITNQFTISKQALSSTSKVKQMAQEYEEKHITPSKDNSSKSKRH